MQHDALDAFASARLIVDLDAILANYAMIVERVAPARAAAVVKADAYGLGAAVVAPALARAGCRDFFVALLSEALELKPLLPADARIYVLNGLAPGAEHACAAAGVRPVINTLDQARRWADQARRSGRRCPAAVQVDSGMSRLGLEAGDVEQLAADPAFSDAVEVVLVMSHLACADNPADASNEAQRRRFAELAERLAPGAPRSLANSGGSLAEAAFHCDLVRPGIALYGGEPIDGGASGLKPVVTLEARVAQVRTIPAGAGVGYGLTYIAPDQRRIATIGLGYADGWPRRLGDRAAAFWRGQRLPIIGRVSMDSMGIDISALPLGAIAEGDFVELIGPEQTLQAVADLAGTVTYEILTSLGRRFARIYRSQTASEEKGQ